MECVTNRHIFSSDTNTEKIASTVHDEKVKRWDDYDQFQSHQEELSRMGLSGKEIDKFFLKQSMLVRNVVLSFTVQTVKILL